MKLKPCTECRKLRQELDTLWPMLKNERENSVPKSDLHKLEILLAAILLNRHDPLASHHAHAIRGILDDRTDAELIIMVRGEE